MTDNEIIKALECCTQQAGCSGCPFVISDEIKYRGGYSCSEALRKNALDLINRQKAENEMLKDLITYQKQEIKEKEQKYNQAVDDMFGLIETTRKEIAEAKSEAIKEFAEKLKNCFAISGDYLDIINIIDNLVKEMMEVNEK